MSLTQLDLADVFGEAIYAPCPAPVTVAAQPALAPTPAADDQPPPWVCWLLLARPDLHGECRVWLDANRFPGEAEAVAWLLAHPGAAASRAGRVIERVVAREGEPPEAARAVRATAGPGA